jgi:predicted ATP-grasp superfamily ATP-dependent carboligase
MHHFLFEFITGGGLSGRDLPESLLNEGKIMLQTLLKELHQAGELKVSMSRDIRIDSFDDNTEQYLVAALALEEVLPKWIKMSDVAWLIAPETGNALYFLAELFSEYGNIYIGSKPDTIKICTSKLLTTNLLAKADISVIETKRINEPVVASSTGWIVKPDDGVGSENCFFIKSENELSEIIDKYKDTNMIMQPYLEGLSLSMSLLVFDNQVRLLACNKQYIEIIEGSVTLTAIGVNECLLYQDKMLALAQKIVTTISGFAGYIGVDLILSDNKLFVVDINPRFTTAYAGISESLGCNVTAKILDVFLNNKIVDIDLAEAEPVRVNL